MAGYEEWIDGCDFFFAAQVSGEATLISRYPCCLFARSFFAASDDVVNRSQSTSEVERILFGPHLPSMFNV